MLRLQCAFHTHSTCQFRAATFHALDGHMSLTLPYWTAQLWRHKGFPLPGCVFSMSLPFPVLKMGTMVLLRLKQITVRVVK